MYDPAPRRGPMTRQEVWTAAIFLAIVIGFLTAEILTNYQPAKLSAVLILLFWLPLVAVHEAGHAVVAACVGWYVGEVVIGMGRTVGRFRAGTARVEVRLLAIEGFVRCVPRNLRWPRLKSALIYFAGPGVELLIAGLVLALAGPDTIFQRSQDYGVIALQSLAAAAAAGAVLNLIPHGVKTENGWVPNDGLGIITSFTVPLGHYADMIGQTYNHEDRDWQSYDPSDWWKR